MKKNIVKICFYWQFQCYYVGAVVFSDQSPVRVSPLFGTEEDARAYLEDWFSRHGNREYYEVK